MSLVSSSLDSGDSALADQILAAQAAFLSLDKLGTGQSGSLDTLKLREALENYMSIAGDEFEERKLQDMIDAVDLNNNRKIEFNEFLKLTENQHATSAAAPESAPDAAPTSTDANSSTASAATTADESADDQLQTKDSLFSIFSAIDTNDDEQLSSVELKKVFDEELSSDTPMTDEQLATLIHLIDPQNKTGSISKAAFIKCMLRQQEQES